ncbi:MAG TPA: phosphatase PAP2 family protein [Burkholderiaceae bacterium]|nr:phosphatase PAP2 family protein [Burkholderiaceae bacterium]
MIFWIVITRVGDSMILVPIALAIAVWLAAGRTWKMAFSWCVLFGLAMLAVIATKLAFIGWGIGSASLDFTGFSGHATRAAAVFPVLFYLLLQSPSCPKNALATLSGMAVASIITISRVVVHAHSISEALSGWLLGTLVSLMFLWGARSSTILLPRRWLLLPSLIFLFSAPFLKPAPAQQLITSAALFLSGHTQAFDRVKLHQLSN